MQHLRNRRHQLVASVALLAILTAACGDIPTATPSSPTSTTTKPAPMPTTTTTTTTVDPNVRTLAMARVLIVEAAKERTNGLVRGSVQLHGPTHLPVRLRPSANAPVTGSLAGVVACIKAHESGDYTEHSHLHDGSGAYQFIPSTWRTWSARARYPGYQYAYLAPPDVQDAVLMYALTHGGAGNWSEKYGADPCTAALPGGG